MADYEKTLHLDIMLEGDLVDQLDIYSLFSDLEGAEISHIHSKMYINKAKPKVEEKIDKLTKK